MALDRNALNDDGVGNENDMGEKLSEKRLDPIREEMRRYDVFERLIVEDHRKEKDLDLHLPLLIVVYRKERKNDLV